MGYFYATQYKKGKDITRWANLLIDKIVNLFKAKPNMRVTRNNNKPEDDFSYNQRKHNESLEVDRILDKIKQSGYNSLNDDEKKRCKYIHPIASSEFLFKLECIACPFCFFSVFGISLSFYSYGKSIDSCFLDYSSQMENSII